MDGDVIKRTTRRRFTAWINAAQRSSGNHTIRVVAVDLNGRRSVATRVFRHCVPAVPDPAFRPLNRARCTDQGFRASFRIRHATMVQRAEVYLDGRLIKTSTRRRFSTWVRVTGLRFGRHTLRIVAINVDGRRSSSSRSFRRCAPAAPDPKFTG